MRVDTATENDLLAALIESAPKPLDPTQEVTASMLAAATGYTKRHAADLLAAAEKRGELVSRWAYHNGSRVRAYRRVTE